MKARTCNEFRAAIQVDDAAPVNYDKNQQRMYSLQKDCFWSKTSTRRINVSNSVNLYFVWFNNSDSCFNRTEITWAAMSVSFLRKSVIHWAQLNIICNFLSMSGIYGATLEDPGSTVNHSLYHLHQAPPPADPTAGLPLDNKMSNHMNTLLRFILLNQPRVPSKILHLIFAYTTFESWRNIKANQRRWASY